MKRLSPIPFFLLVLISLLIHTAAIAQSTAVPTNLADRITQVENSLTPPLIIEGEKLFTIQQRMQLYNIPAVTIAVVKDYKIDWAKAYGYADVSEKRLADASTRFQAASISKSLNAMSLLKLAQEKKIDLFADINNYLTSWKFPYDSVSKNKKISVANLLSHTAGLTIHGFPGYKPTATLPSVEQIINGQAPANTKAVRSQAEPGVKSVYSGGGTTISQLIVMDVAKSRYEDYALKNVLQPIGMTNSFYGVNSTLGQPQVLATAYTATGAEIEGKYHIYPELGAAALWTTPTDLGKFIIETQLSLQGKSNKVLSQELTRLMLTPYIDKDAALGVFISKGLASSNAYFQHGGANEGFRSQYFGSMEGGNGVVVMVNSNNGAIMQEIINSVAKVYQWTDFHKPIIKKIVAVPDEVSNSYVGKYEIAPQFILNVFKENGLLRTQATGQGIVDIFPEAENKYFVKVANIALEFGKDEKVTIFQNGGKRVARRL